MTITDVDYLTPAPEDGSSPVVLQLGSPSGYVNCNAAGTTPAEGSAATRLSMLSGNTPLDITSVTCRIQGVTLGTGYTSDPAPSQSFRAVTNASTGEVIIYAKVGTNLMQPVQVVITAAATVDGQTVSREVTFTVCGLVPGEGGETYQILSDVGSVTIGSNLSSATLATMLRFFRKVGTSARTGYTCHASLFARKGNTYTFVQRMESQAAEWTIDGITVNEASYDAAVVCIYDTARSVHSNYIAELEIPVRKNGNAGPSYWPSGTYDPSVEYTRTALRTPLVWVDDESTWNEYAQAYGDYWELAADTNVVGSTHYPPSDGNVYWRRAENYSVVMMGAQFARYAKNGAGIMAGDYFYSANGSIDGVSMSDGVGAAGGAVTASNPPAYTRFMGDPDELGGRFARTAIKGPIASSRTVLVTVYLARGARIMVSISGNTTSGNEYFNIYRNGGAVATRCYINAGGRNVSIDYTAQEAGEYTIECYGSSSAISATFTGSYEISGHFVPVWWVNLKTGKMSGASGNFVSYADGTVKVEGTIKARNLFRNVLWFGEGGYYSKTVLYVKTLNDTSEEYGYSVGDYILGSPPSGVTTDGMLYCTYDADTVVILASSDPVTNDTPVLLPPPEDFPGKIVEVKAYAASGIQKTFRVRCVSRALLHNVRFNPDAWTVLAPDCYQMADPVLIETGSSRSFYSIEAGGTWWWVCI